MTQLHRERAKKAAKKITLPRKQVDDQSNIIQVPLPEEDKTSFEGPPVQK